MQIPSTHLSLFKQSLFDWYKEPRLDLPKWSGQFWDFFQAVEADDALFCQRYLHEYGLSFGWLLKVSYPQSVVDVINQSGCCGNWIYYAIHHGKRRLLESLFGAGLLHITDRFPVHHAPYSDRFPYGHHLDPICSMLWCSPDFTRTALLDGPFSFEQHPSWFLSSSSADFSLFKNFVRAMCYDPIVDRTAGFFTSDHLKADSMLLASSPFNAPSSEALNYANVFSLLPRAATTRSAWGLHTYQYLIQRGLVQTRQCFLFLEQLKVLFNDGFSSQRTSWITPDLVLGLERFLLHQNYLLADQNNPPICIL